MIRDIRHILLSRLFQVRGLLVTIGLLCCLVGGNNLSWAGPAQPALNTQPAVVVSRLETRFFSHEFGQESIEARLTRIEHFMFGESYPKKTVQQRIDKLKEFDEVALEPEDQLNAPQQQSAPIAQQPVTQQVVQPGETSYPAVEEMEMVVFKQRFPGKPLDARLSALEQQVFHQQFQGTLQERRDRLEMVVLQTQPAPSGPMANQGGYSAPQQLTPQQAQYLAGQVSQLESQLFGRVYGNEPLDYRIGRLESAVFHTTAPEMQPYERIDRVQTVLQAKQSSRQEVASRRGGVTSTYYTSRPRMQVHRGGINTSQTLMMVMMMVLSAL